LKDKINYKKNKKNVTLKNEIKKKIKKIERKKQKYKRNHPSKLELIFLICCPGYGTELT
jgi:hypothetical protein